MAAQDWMIDAQYPINDFRQPPTNVIHSDAEGLIRLDDTEFLDFDEVLQNHMIHSGGDQGEELINFDYFDFDEILKNCETDMIPCSIPQKTNVIPSDVDPFMIETNVIHSNSRELMIIDDAEFIIPEEMSRMSNNNIQECLIDSSPVLEMQVFNGGGDTTGRDAYTSQNMPIGYRFKPKDTELIYCLRKIFNNEPVPTDKIHVLNLYEFNAPNLVDYIGDNDDGHGYFITPLKAKNKGTKYRDRTTPNGFWKATSGEHTIMHGGLQVGSRKTLVYYEGKGKRSKTDWIMHEYRLKDDPMDENRWVICKIHNGKRGKSNKR